jgi:hypothetical protein
VGTKVMSLTGTPYTLPQWSLPVIGGTPAEFGNTMLLTFTSQWSPPVIGGGTNRGTTDPVNAMLPQWSPPVSAGAPAWTWLVVNGDMGAMEPVIGGHPPRR